MMANDETNLLEHLLRKGTTPSFSFPLDVCEFKVEGLDNWTPKTYAKMGQDLRKGLVEYSPGREIVVNGVKYLVGGLAFFNPPDKINQAKHVFSEGLNSSALKWYNRCVGHRCGWVSKKMDGPVELEECPVCGGEIRPGRWYRPEAFAPIIVPYTSADEEAKGNLKWQARSWSMKAQDPRSVKTEQAKSRIELPAPLLGEELDDDLKIERIDNIPGLEDIAQRMSILSSETDLADSSKGIELILINSGYNNRGYFLCPDCGRTEIKNTKPFFGPNGQGHHRPYAPGGNIRGLSDEQKEAAKELCTSSPLGHENENNCVMLGMTFRTDVIIFRFEKPECFVEGRNLFSSKEYDGGIKAIKEALIEEIQAKKEFINREIGGGIRKFKVYSEESGNRFFTDIFLFDQVSGGAGLTTEVISDLPELPEILENVETRLSGTKCVDGIGCDMACIGCLLDFRNSQEHNQLDRRNGLRLLRYVMYGQIPTIEQGETIANGNQIQLQQMVQSISIDTGFSVSQEDNGSGHILVVKNGLQSVKIRPLSEIVNRMDDPVLSTYHRRKVKPIDLDSSYHQTPSDDSIFYLHIGKFSRYRTKLASVLKQMLLPLEEQDL